MGCSPGERLSASLAHTLEPSWVKTRSCLFLAPGMSQAFHWAAGSRQQP